MRNRRIAVFTLLAAAAASAATAAPLRGDGPARDAAAPAVADHLAQIDGPVTTVAGPDGRLWAVWSYRAAGEFDVAISTLSAAGVWSSPQFYGGRDGVDEIEPALAVDAAGAVYLVYATREPSGLALVTLSPGAAAWSAPVRLTEDRTASSPTVRIIGDRVAVAWRTERGVVLVDLPKASGDQSVRGIQDGPDSVDPLGVTSPGGGTGGSGSGMGTGSGSDGSDGHGSHGKS